MKKVKWLDYFRDEFNASPSFIHEMDLQLRPVFEGFFGRPMNWLIVWLFIEPTGEALKYTIDEKGNKVAKLECALSNRNLMGVWSNVIWYSVDNDRYIEPSEEVTSGQIIFKVIDISDKFNVRDSYPGADYVEPLVELNFGLDFPVMVEGKHIGHEGYICIKSSEKVMREDMLACVRKIQDDWNDEDIEILSFKGYRGKLHQLYQEDDNAEDGTYLLYFDSGSAVNGVHEYIIKKLAEEYLGIEKIVIKSL